MSFEQIYRLVEIATTLGINRLKITGGEPLVRKGIAEFIKELKNLPLKDISLTTNGFFLEEKAQDLAKAGLKRINISLDTLDENEFESITGQNQLDKVMRGIKKAIHLFDLIKVNVVLNKKKDGYSFIELAKKYPLQVRFIELMPYEEDGFISNSQLLKELSQKVYLQLVQGYGSGPAQYFKIADCDAVVGFISPYSNGFCSHCNRIRVTADGFIKPCLFSREKFNIKESLENNQADEVVEQIKKAVLSKPKDHGNSRELVENMNIIGG